MIKAVLFDLDETLILRSGAIRAFIKDQYARFAPRLGGIGEEEYIARFLETEMNGVIGKDVAYPKFVDLMGIAEVSSDELLEDYRQHYADFASPSPGAVETVRTLHEWGMKTGILTNGNVRVQNAKIDAIGLRDALDAIIISEAVGLRKPDPAIFELAVASLGVGAASTLFVGDNPEVDIVGGAKAGLQTAWFRNGLAWPEGLEPRADVDIDSVSEILHYVGK
ncbi:MAG TPA: HAD family hydrolase [Devosiaceae bacterium]|nr:HAD family hydrolase [Devosiaceae bacterium]